MRIGIPIFLAIVSLGPAMAQTSGDEQALFGDLPTVEAASLHAQTLAEAPATVSVITAEDIRRYGYRTLAEALGSVRGFHVSYDHSYHHVGLRGISLPGDFNTRFLVMLNGHPLTDNIYNSNGYFGQDFGLDMDLVERIEIIRGPTSALYGSNGMFATINVVTRSPVDGGKLRVTLETGSFGERKLGVSSSVYLGAGANLLISASAFNNGGQSFPLSMFRGVALPAGVGDTVDNTDGERGYHTFANLIWRNWSFTGYFNARRKSVPLGVGTSLAADDSQFNVDVRGLAGATWRRQWGAGRIQWQTFYDRYRYSDRYNYPVDDAVQTVRDYNVGDWLDSQLTYELPVSNMGTLTAGIAGTWELRNQQYNVVDGAKQGVISRPDRGLALFAQQEWNLSSRWRLYGGLRYDRFRNFQHFASPRLALVYQYSPQTVYKLVYGRPFRNPSTFEQYYNDGGLSYAAAPRLNPEMAHAFEASMERRIGRGWTAVVNVSHYRLGRVIEAVALDSAVQQYQNAGRIRSTGAEFELSGKLGSLETSASVAIQSAINYEGQWVSLENSPRQVSKARLGLPLLGQRVFLAGSLQFVSARRTWTEDRLGGAVLADFTATARIHPGFDIQAGLRNALDRRYEDPIYLTLDRLRGDGRSAFLRLVWRPCD